MDTHAARLLLSPKTGPAAISTRTRTLTLTLTPDQQAWRTFLDNPDTLTWVRSVICRRLGYHPRRGRATDESWLDEVMGDVLLALVAADGFRFGCSAQSFACDLIHKTMTDGLRYRHADCRSERRSVDLNGARFQDTADPRVSAGWQRDLIEEDRQASRLTSDAVRTLLTRLTGDARIWAEMYLWREHHDDGPADPDATNAFDRPDPIRWIAQRLRWSRHRCDRARSALKQALASLRPARPRP